MKTGKYYLQLFTIYLLFFAGSVHAGLVELTLSGTTQCATPGNAFGLSNGDSVNLSALFDDSNFTRSGYEVISFTEDTGHFMNMTFRDLQFTERNDASFYSGFPLLIFFDGLLQSLDYVAYSGANGAPAYLSSTDIAHKQSFWYGLDDANKGVYGHWDFDNATLSDVAVPTADIPEPGPLALACIGLVGAWITTRRRRSLR